VWPDVLEIRNSSYGPRVLLTSPATTRVGERQRSTHDGGGEELELGVSIFLLVVGAILTFAVDVSASGFSLNTVGIILMIAGPLAWFCRCCFGAALRRIGAAGPWPAPTRWSRSGASSAISPSPDLT
jgi:hypothetical protein